MPVLPELELPVEVLRSFAKRHGMQRLAVFGSRSRGDNGPASDLDLLVEFAPDRVPGLLGMSGMELELEELLGVSIDLRTMGDLSHLFRDEVRRSAVVVYDHAA